MVCKIDHYGEYWRLKLSTETDRKELIQKLFPQGIPRLWSPPLAHYTASLDLDKKHTRSHLVFMAPYVKTHLVPGSTGDGWELSQREIDNLIEFMITETRDLDIRLLIGVLRSDMEKTREDIKKAVRFLVDITGSRDAENALYSSGVCGFTVCAPKGKGIPQEVIYEKLSSVLDLGYPVALYQLPQVTENEIAPETFEKLAGKYGNFYLFKDTSGRDRVALSKVDTGGVFMVRGGEGNYRRWYKASPGGLYDGFLLGSANSFAGNYSVMLRNIDSGRHEAAENISVQITRIVSKAMEEAGKLSFGNAFANSNKAIDHFLAYGPGADEATTPMTHSGRRLPPDFIRYIKNLLAEEGMLPEKGYLEAAE
jgi:dihydrodipicolinate synthase/N-acetylneuraminate lyase